MTETTGALGSTDEWRLRDERQFLVQSLDDAGREHAAGDLSDADFELLRRRDQRRLDEVEAALAALVTKADVRDAHRTAAVAGGAELAPDDADADPERSAWPTLALDEDEDAPAPGVRRHRRIWLALTGVTLLVAGVVVLVLNVATPSQPGQTPTGSIAQTGTPHNVVRQQLAQANKLAAQGTIAQAITLYGDVLTEEQTNVKALASWGWLTFQVAVEARTLTATVVAESESAVARALQLDPALYPAQYYLGDMLYQQGKYVAAVQHLSRFVALHPPTRWMKAATHVLRSAYTRAGVQLPPTVPFTTGAPGTTPLPGSASGSSTATSVPSSTTTTTGSSAPAGTTATTPAVTTPTMAPG